jgi:hypothetical protein
MASVELVCIRARAGRDEFPGTRDLLVSGTPDLVPYRVYGETIL